MAASSEPSSTTEAAALAGDHSAWNALVARHNQKVIVALIAHGVRPAVARELAQDTWLRLLNQATEHRLDRLELPGLAIRQALFLARSHARDERPLATMRIDESVPSDEARLLSREELQRASEILAQCNPMAQRVFKLVYLSPQLTHAEVAARVGLSAQRVKQIVCEVRAELRSALRGVDDER